MEKTFFKVFFGYKKLIIHNKIAPGIPRRPTNKAVRILIPICNPQYAPIRLSPYRKTPPKMELINKRNNHFKGTIKIFPITNIPIKQIK